MSSAKRTRQRPSEAGAVSSLPPAKKARISQEGQRPSEPSLDFLTDESKRHGKTLKANLTNGVGSTTNPRPDESTVVVRSQSLAADRDGDAEESEGPKDADDVSSVVSDSSEYESSEADKDPEDMVPEFTGTKHDLLTNGFSDHIDEGEDAQPRGQTEIVKIRSTPKNTTEDEQEEQIDGPSFGELVQAAYPETIDIPTAFADQHSQAKALVPADNSRNLQAPAANSLGTVLTQALRTNDKELLESCLQTKDIASIQSTIQRLQSPFVATLLQRLAERLHKRPGRAGPLMTWIQWSLVAHGGYLASQPKVTRKLKSLHQVVRERANSLPSLLLLKGKLDMLNAQIELRRNMQAQQSAQDSDQDEADVVYIEGQDEDSTDDESEGSVTSPAPLKHRGSAPHKENIDTITSNGVLEDKDDAVMINGIDEAEEEEDDEDEDLDMDEDGDVEGGGLIDDMAEETSNDDGDDASSEDDESTDGYEEDEGQDEDDEEDDISASEEEVVVPQKTRPQTRSSLAKRR